MYLFDKRIPYYEQIKSDISQKIDKKEYLLGDKLPSEIILAEKYGVSRPTVRQAILDLVKEGLLERQRGKGTFITKPIITEKIEGFKGFEQLKGLKWLKLINTKKVHASAELAEDLYVTEGTLINELNYLMGDDREPLVKRKFQFATKLSPDLMEINLENESIYDYIKKQFTITDIRLSFQSISADKKETKILSCKIGTPLTEFTIIIYNESHEPIIRIVTTYRGDRFKFIIDKGENWPIELNHKL